MKFTLKPRKLRHKDYSFTKTHKLGATILSSELLFLSPVLDQGQLDECTSYAAVATRYNETGNQVFDPTAFWLEQLAFAGITNETYQGGFDIEVPAATAVLKGFPNFNPSTYFWITSGNGNDLFDNCRIAMAQFQRPLIGGLTWYNEYSSAPQGLISGQGTTVAGGHCIKIAGWKTINGSVYMVLQNSWGTAWGDNGLYYISRELFNTSFAPYGVFYWLDSTSTQVKTLGYIQALYQNILTLIGQWGSKTGYPPVSLIPQLAEGIFAAEGGEKAFGYHLNNPGDIKNFTGNRYVASLGATGTVEGFAQFPDMAAGIKACQQLCSDVANNLLKGYPKNATISQFCQIYADPPVLENYTNTVLTFLPGKVASTKLNELI